MAQNPATWQDLVNRGYVLVSPDPHTVETTRLGEAWRALIGELPTLPARMDAGQVDLDTVKDVVSAAALRVLDNPRGSERVDYAIDDWRESETLANATKDMYFTAAELRRLSPVSYGAGSVQYS